MIVLDADSLIDGSTLLLLVRRMQADPALGILQTAPQLIGARTFFGRLQQFAACVYGPVVSRGLSAWSGDSGNYWGHNAIIRVAAFAQCCGLPELRGPQAVRRSRAVPRFRRGGADAPRRLEGAHGDRLRRLLGGIPAIAHRRGHSRPPLGSGQPAAHENHRRGGIELRQPSASGHRHHELPVIAPVAADVGHRLRARPAVAPDSAGILQSRFPAVSHLAAVRRRTDDVAVLVQHGRAADSEDGGPGACLGVAAAAARRRRGGRHRRQLFVGNPPLGAVRAGADADSEPACIRGLPGARFRLEAAAARQRRHHLAGSLALSQAGTCC